MKNKILKLCKRLNKVTIEEIAPILQATVGEICPVLDELVMEGRLDLRADGVYFYKEQSFAKQTLPLFFEFRTKEELDLIIKCFCAELTSIKSGLITGLSADIIGKFHKHFRKIIYEKQKTELEKYFNKNPQQFRTRNFYGQTVYFYYYDKLYITDKPYNFSLDYSIFTQSEIRNFKAMYCKINRLLSHNKRRKFIFNHIAEFIWRDSKSFETLVNELYLLLSI